MAFVVDASVAAAWLLPDESSTRAGAAFERLADEAAMVPGLWWFEIRNVLLVNERRGRIDQRVTDQALSLLSGLPILFDRDADSEALMLLAHRHRLTTYDAAYLELAVRLQAPMATLDDALTRAARAESIELI